MNIPHIRFNQETQRYYADGLPERALTPPDHGSLTTEEETTTERRDVLGRRITRVHVATYAAVHQRLALSDRGLCVRCESPANEWALKSDASERLHDKNGLTFSSHESDYEPMCTKCHRRADKNAQTMWDRHYDQLMNTRARGLRHVGNSKLTLKQVAEIKNRSADGETGRDLAKLFNVSEGTISMIINGKRWNTKLQLNQGFTLIEILITVTIVGILAAIALPAYQDYVIRSKMAEPMAAIAACKTAVAEYASVKAAYPPDAATAGCSDTATTYTASLRVTDGVIEATSRGTGAKPAECVLTLSPPAGGATAITAWTGTFSGCNAKYVPSSFR